MKAIVVINYWLMIVSWCLFLNGSRIFSEVVAVICCMMLFRYRRINCLKTAIQVMICFAMVHMVLHFSSIPYFFPNLSIHLLLVVIDCVMGHEYLKRLSSHFILPIMLVMILSILYTTFLIIVIPAEYYSIFGKTNLLLLEAFIFLPYLISCLLCYVSDTQDSRLKTKGAVTK